MIRGLLIERSKMSCTVHLADTSGRGLLIETSKVSCTVHLTNIARELLPEASKVSCTPGSFCNV